MIIIHFISLPLIINQIIMKHQNQQFLIFHPYQIKYFMVLNPYE